MEPHALAMLLGPLGTTELLIIVLILLLLFGGRKIPELARGLGKGISEFKQGMRQGADETKESGDAAKPQAPNKRNGGGPQGGE